MDQTVSAVQTAGYKHEELRQAVARHFQLLRVGELLHPGMKVVVKPNLLMRRTPEEATTTHPALLQAVVEQLLELGIPREGITIADSPGGPYNRALLDTVYKTTGMAAAAKATGVELNQGTGWQTVPADKDCLCREWSIIDPVAQADFVVNLPKLKTHAMTTLSGGIKNLFGCIAGLLKPQLHFQFPEKDRFGRMLVELALQVKPGLTLVDAVTSMEGDGPSGGQPRHTGMTFAARNVFVLDRALCDFIGLSPREVPMVEYAIARGLCPERVEDIRYVGDGRPAAVEDYRKPASKSPDFLLRLPSWLQGPARVLERRFLIPRPVIHRRGCIGCAKCAESCAPGAVAVRENRKAYIDYKKCITCYCCHEMCPVKTIGIRRTPLNF